MIVDLAFPLHVGRCVRGLDVDGLGFIEVAFPASNDTRGHGIADDVGRRAAHEIIGKLRDLTDGAMLDDLAEVLYGYALLAEGSELSDPLKFNQAIMTSG